MGREAAERATGTLAGARRWRRRTLALTLILASGAAAAGCTRPVRTEAGAAGFGGFGSDRGVRPDEASTFSGHVDGAPSEVFAVMGQVYERLGLPVDYQDPARLTLGANDALLRRLAGGPLSPFLSCSSVGGRSTDDYDVRVSVQTTVSAAEGGGTDVGTRLTGQATHPNPLVDPEFCASTGQLERRIVEEVHNWMDRGPA